VQMLALSRLARADRRPRGVALAALAAVALAAALAFLPDTAAASVRWCGNDSISANRLPDLVAGNQVHVIYAIPSDGANRFPETAQAIVSDLAAIDAWWRGQDPTRTLRFDLFAFPGCEPGMGQLDLSFFRLRHDAAFYDRKDTDRVTEELYLDLLPTYGRRHEKYLVFYDGPTRQIDACGVASEKANYAIIYLQPPDGCFEDPGTAGFTAMVTAHELVHVLGGAPPLAPNRCRLNPGHVCDDPRDIIYGIPHRLELSDRLLDVNNDDYYAHSGRWWDVQDSPFLRRLQAPMFPLEVSVEGDGRVASQAPGLSCPGVCRIEWESGSKVTLTAAPTPGMAFAGWKGACRGTASTCTVTIAGAAAATATFGPPKPPGTTGPTMPTSRTRNQAPVASFTTSPTTYRVGRPVTFTSTSRDPDGSIAKLEWSFGDGKTATGAVVTHTFTAGRAYFVSLRVTDDAGARATARQRITVVDPPPVVRARAASVKRSGTATLRFAFADEAGGTLRRARIEILAGERRVGSIFLFGRAAPKPVARWRAPSQPARLRWCVRAWDNAGNQSRPSCAPLRVR
jgi:PKD repeat protein